MMFRWPRLAAWTLVLALAGAGFARAGSPPPLAKPPAMATTAKPKTEERPQLSIDPDGQITYEQKDGHTMTVARKGALLEAPGFRLEANQISLDTENGQPTGMTEAIGEVKLTHEAMRLLARKVSYDMQKQTINTQEVRMGKPPVYFDGVSFTGTAQEAQIDHPTLFFSEPDAFGLNIAARSAIYHADTQAVEMQGVTLRVGAVPFFYLPSYTQGREDEPPMSLQARFGYRKDLGGYGQTTTFWTKSPLIDPGLLLDYYSKRGVLAGPALKYHSVEDPDWLQDGTMESGYIHDTGNRGLDLVGNAIPRDRYFVNWQHKGTIDGQVDLTSSMYWWSDSNVLRDYRQGLWQNNQFPDNFVEAVHREQNAFVSAFVRYQPDNFQVTQQRLPEVRFDYMPSPLFKTGIYQEGQINYAMLEQRNYNGTPTLHSSRFDGYYGWRRPINISTWATLTPVAGTRITHYADTLQQQGQFTRVLGQFGFDAEARAFGRWDYNNALWGVNGLQHTLRPVMMYRYITNANSGQGRIPVIDQDNFTPYPPIIDLGDTRNVDGPRSDNVLRYGLENLFQTRDQTYGSRDLASFNAYNDIHFSDTPGGHQFSNVWTTMTLTPSNWLNFEVFNRFDPAVATEREVRTRTSIIDGDQWGVAFTTDNLQHQVAQYWLEARYRINDRNQIIGRWRFDQHLGGLTQQSYSWRMRLGNAWDVEWSIAYNRGTQNENGFGFNVRFILLAF